MKKYFESIVNTLGIIIAISTSLLESFSLEIKLLVFISIAFVTILISYIYSTIKYKKLSKENINLANENANLKQQLDELNSTVSLQKGQLQYFSESNNSDNSNEIVII